MLWIVSREGRKQEKKCTGLRAFGRSALNDEGFVLPVNFREKVMNDPQKRDAVISFMLAAVRIRFSYSP